MRFIKYYASVSFGKDSLAMLLYVLENKLPLDEVVFYDTGMEFQAIYRIRDEVKSLLSNAGVKFVELKPSNPFLYDMLYRTKTKRDGTVVSGDGWCGGPCRWGTFAKQRVINEYVGDGHTYLGIAADEPQRLSRLEPNKSSPIADAGMTEDDCLLYCYNRGFNWLEDGVELYDVLDRVSCWCCRNKNLKELRNIYMMLPRYWERLRGLQSEIQEPMKGKDASVFDLERRFVLEKECKEMGMSITSREFHRMLRDVLKCSNPQGTE